MEVKTVVETEVVETEGRHGGSEMELETVSSSFRPVCLSSSGDVALRGGALRGETTMRRQSMPTFGVGCFTGRIMIDMYGAKLAICYLPSAMLGECHAVSVSSVVAPAPCESKSCFLFPRNVFD